MHLAHGSFVFYLTYLLNVCAALVLLPLLLLMCLYFYLFIILPNKVIPGF
eukprot:jgi/Botrbrau1/16426/Bobra.0142s0025.1